MNELFNDFVSAIVGLTVSITVFYIRFQWGRYTARMDQLYRNERMMRAEGLDNGF